MNFVKIWKNLAKFEKNSKFWCFFYFHFKKICSEAPLHAIDRSKMNFQYWYNFSLNKSKIYKKLQKFDGKHQENTKNCPFLFSQFEFCPKCIVHSIKDVSIYCSFFTFIEKKFQPLWKKNIMPLLVLDKWFNLVYKYDLR